MGDPNRLYLVLGSTKVPVAELSEVEKAGVVLGMVAKLKPYLDFLPGFHRIAELVDDPGFSPSISRTRHTNPHLIGLGGSLQVETWLFRLGEVDISQEPKGADRAEEMSVDSLWLTRRGEVVLWQARYKLAHDFTPHARGAYHSVHEEAQRSAFTVLDPAGLIEVTSRSFFNLAFMLQLLAEALDKAIVRREQQIRNLSVASGWLEEVRERLKPSAIEA